MKNKKIALILSLVIGTITLFPSMTYAESNGWGKSQGKWYFYENGSKKSGWLKDEGSWYFLDSKEGMLTGWHNIANK